MKKVLRFLGIFVVCWFTMWLVMLFAGAHSNMDAVVTAAPVALVLAAVIAVIAYFVRRIEKLEYAVKLLEHRVGELEKSSK